MEFKVNNNKIFNRILQLTGCDFDKENLIYIFYLGGLETSKSKIKGWKTALDNPRSTHMPDEALDAFITGLFEYRDIKEQKGEKVFNFPRNNKGAS